MGLVIGYAAKNVNMVFIPSRLWSEVKKVKLSLDLQSLQEHSQHPHTSYIEISDLNRLEEIVMKSYRQCNMKRKRQDFSIEYADNQCTACSHSKFSLC